MKRTLFVLLAIFCLLPVLLLPATAASARLADNAGLLTAQEAAEVQALLDEISARQGVDIVIVTVASTGERSAMEYADDYFDYNDYRLDGILLLLSMDTRDWWVSTAGYGITAITDAGLNYISDRFVPYLSDEDYARGFTEFATLCDEFITQAKTGHPYDTGNLPKNPFRLGLNLLVALGLGSAGAMFATGSMKNKLQSVSDQTRADHYAAPGSLQLTQSRELFLYTHLDRREKTSSGSGSSTHTSSSGTVHGGGGGKF